MAKQKEATVIFRPESRDARKDYRISLEAAKNLFSAGMISQDMTNGGYMPNSRTPSNFLKLYKIKD